MEGRTRLTRERLAGLEDLLKPRGSGPLPSKRPAARSVRHFFASAAYAWSRHPPVDSAVRVAQTRSSSPRSTDVTIVCVSDTHNEILASVPDGDVLIHAGDLTETGTLKELQATLDWLAGQPHEHKFVIAGNHDTELASPDDRDRLDWQGIVYLDESSARITIRGRRLHVYGSAYTPRFGNFAFQYPRQEASERWAGVPDDVDVLVTHGPAKTHLDHSGAGCAGLGQALWRVKPTLHVFGHIHAGRGAERLHFDRAQALYEEVVARRPVGDQWRWIEVAGLAWHLLTSALVRWWIRPLNGHLAVNAAVKGGSRNELVRTAVVVVI